MAGPGGGPPRKSHTKSRKGCRVCKNRHIRCDENFPQCRNCTKHSVRCDYMDVSKAGEELAKDSSPPELLTSPQLQQALDKWRITGECPLPELRKDEPMYWTRFSTIDLRLLHHISTLSSDMYRKGYSSCTPWTPKMSNIISVALTSDYTMNALLALSAAHLAWRTKNSGTEHLVYHHRGNAMKGLHEALGNFSEHSSEAVLASSMLLSWQAKDWQSWVSLQQGISTVMLRMRPWMHQSELTRFLDSQRAFARTKAPSTPIVTGLPYQQPAAEDIQRLEQIVNALHSLRIQLSTSPELLQHIDDALEYVDLLQQDYPMRESNQAFEHLLYLRSVIFWLPTTVLRSDASDLGPLAMLSHFFALALVLEPLFPEIAGAYLGNVSLEPLEKVYQLVQTKCAAVPHDTDLQTALSMMKVPMQIAYAYRTSRRAVTSPIAPYQYSPPISAIDYSSRALNLTSPLTVVPQSSYPLQSGYPVSTYQPTIPGLQESVGSRSHSDPRLSIGSSMQSMSSSHNNNNELSQIGSSYFGESAPYWPGTYSNGTGGYRDRLVPASASPQIRT